MRFILLFAALIAGTWSDVPPPNPPLTLGRYRVLAADFHVHEYPFSAGTLAPWDLVLEARRQGLDVIAITGQNYATAGNVGRWFGRLVGSPLVLAGEEIHAPGYHLIAVGIHQTISWRSTAAQSIAEVHRQGGVAIAAHPVAQSWPAYNATVISMLDGAEVKQPIVFSYRNGAAELRQFFARGHLTAIGSSDFHGMGPVGFCRTYVFARDATEQAVLEALRQGHTVVYDATGAAFGDEGLIRMAAAYGQLRQREPAAPSNRILDWVSRICGVAGMVALAMSYSAKEV